jgi:YD repeat-containing protein
LTTLNLSSPFLPSKNIDYKRGLLKSEVIYNQESKELNKTDYIYEFVDYNQITGFRTFYSTFDFINMYNHTFFYDYKNYISSCFQYEANSTNPTNDCNNLQFTYDNPTTPDNECFCFCYYGKVRDFTTYKFIEETYGWAKLSSKITQNYFYDQNNIQKIVETKEEYLYNPINKMISESKVTNSLGEEIKTNYFYHTGNSTMSQNRISEIERIESYKDNVLLSKTQINYNNNWDTNSSYLPKTILTSKGAAGLETRVRFNKYDEFSHPLELQQENGTVVSYIWGYNKTQPIAKIENADNQRIAQALGISNLNALTEADLPLINTLRSLLPNTMVTTYTYIPLVGVSSITDLKGDTITYQYDSFGRLSSVTDSGGNVLSENEYHYKTQN